MLLKERKETRIRIRDFPIEDCTVTGHAIGRSTKDNALAQQPLVFVGLAG